MEVPFSETFREGTSFSVTVFINGDSMKENTKLLISASLMMASSIGIMTNASGVFFTSVAESLSIGRGAVSMTLTIASIAYAIGGLFTARLMHERNFLKMVFLSALLYGITTAGLGFCHSILPMYVLSIIRGFSTGMAGMVLVTMLIQNHFEKNVGLMTSIALGFSGIAGALLSPLFSGIISAWSWRVGYIVAGVLSFLLYMPCVLFRVRLNNRLKGENETVKRKNVGGGSVTAAAFLTALLFTFADASATAVPQHFPSMAASASIGALMVSVAMVLNTAGKIILGTISDKIGTTKSLVLYGILVTAGLLLLLFGAGHTICALSGAGLVGLVYGMSALGPVLLSRKLFCDSYDRYYPKVALVGTLSNALFTTVVGSLYDLSGSYGISLGLVSCLTVLAVAMVILSDHVK